MSAFALLCSLSKTRAMYCLFSVPVVSITVVNTLSFSMHNCQIKLYYAFLILPNHVQAGTFLSDNSD